MSNIKFESYVSDRIPITWNVNNLKKYLFSSRFYFSLSDRFSTSFQIIRSESMFNRWLLHETIKITQIVYFRGGGLFVTKILPSHKYNFVCFIIPTTVFEEKYSRHSITLINNYQLLPSKLKCNVCELIIHLYISNFNFNKFI